MAYSNAERYPASSDPKSIVDVDTVIFNPTWLDETSSWVVLSKFVNDESTRITLQLAEIGGMGKRPRIVCIEAPHTFMAYLDNLISGAEVLGVLHAELVQSLIEHLVANNDGAGATWRVELSKETKRSSLFGGSLSIEDYKMAG